MPCKIIISPLAILAGNLRAREAQSDEVDRSRAVNDGVVCYLCKPVDDYQLESCLRSALNGGEPHEYS
jgi:DNA-binding NarL/FixJ family response regulator